MIGVNGKVIMSGVEMDITFKKQRAINVNETPCRAVRGPA